MAETKLRIRIRMFLGLLNPDPLVGTRNGPGSGSKCHAAKIVRKTLIPTVLWLLLGFFYLKNDINVASKSKKQKNGISCQHFFQKIHHFVLGLFCTVAGSIQEKYNLLLYSVGHSTGWRVEPRVRLRRPWAHPGGPPQVRPDRTPRDVAQG